MNTQENTGIRAHDYPPSPHRGAVVLVLGILGITNCFILGIVAWVMANTDLAEMNAGRMDPSGRGLTQAGKILGIISVAVILIPIAIFLIIMMGVFIMGIFGAAFAIPC